jgi:hypothetical protein
MTYSGGVANMSGIPALPNNLLHAAKLLAALLIFW